MPETPERPELDTKASASFDASPAVHAVDEEMQLIVDGDLPAVDPKRRNKSRGGAVIAAAMLGLGHVLEPDKTEVSIEHAGEARDPDDDVLAKLSFGDLPPLN